MLDRTLSEGSGELPFPRSEASSIGRSFPSRTTADHLLNTLRSLRILSLANVIFIAGALGQGQYEPEEK